MKYSVSSLLALIPAFAIGAVACDKKPDDAGTGATTAATAPAAAATAAGAAAAAPGAAAPKVGDSCKGIGAMDAKMVCDGRKVMFCSSYTKYEWTVQNECPEGQVCNMNADGKSSGCK